MNEYSRDNKLICITSESSGELMFLVMWFWMTENGGGIVNYMKCSLLSSSTAISKLSLLSIEKRTLSCGVVESLHFGTRATAFLKMIF